MAVCNYRIGLVVVLGCWFAGQSSTVTASEPAYGIETRVPWQNRQLRGFPDPLSPYKVERVYKELAIKKPLSIGTFPKSDWMWVTNHDSDYGGPGRIFRFRDQADVASAELLVELPEIIYGLAFHPRFAENGYVYVGCNGHSEKLDAKATRVLRLTLAREAPFVVEEGSMQLVLEWASDGHNGGDVAFGPDGMLYVSAGDGTSDSDTNLAGQDLTSLNGSMLRIDIDHNSDDQPYRVPPDNPFLHVPDARPEIWAFGLRNPWRITYDQLSDQLWVGNNGQDLWESVHLIHKGENYGWSVNEASHPFQPQRPHGPAPIVPATVEHPHSEARSLTGGIVYRGQRFAELVGAYIYGDYSTGNIWAVKHDGQRVVWHRHIARSTLQISGFGSDTRGELVIVDHAGGLYGLEPQAQPTNHVPFPKKLSQTALFFNGADMEPAPGLIPYSVQSPLWSDGATKSRWMAVPDGQQIELTEHWGWNFPAQSVLVKTFSLPAAADGLDRRVETRLMVKVDNEWFGYSYAWDDEQSDAELVASAGAERTFEVRDAAAPGQRRDQVWRFPSRTECMVCHTRAANYVLGVTTAQMNRDHDYGGMTDNQLRTLAHIGVLKLPSTPGKKKSQSEESQSDTAPRDADIEMTKRFQQLADPLDERQPLEARARAYLHANCAHCHTGAGGGNSKLELSMQTPRDKMFLVDASPQHDSFKVPEAKLAAPGHPERSLLLNRLSRRGPGQMPPLATNVVDHAGMALLESWIESLAP